jgi:hypothetical protein
MTNTKDPITNWHNVITSRDIDAVVQLRFLT